MELNLTWHKDEMSVQTWFWFHLWIIKYKPDIIIRFNTGLQFIRGILEGWRIVPVLRWPGLNERIAVSKKLRAMLSGASFNFVKSVRWTLILNAKWRQWNEKDIQHIHFETLYNFRHILIIGKGFLKFWFVTQTSQDELKRMTWYDDKRAKHNA